MRKIALVPLDDRPCNTRYPVRIGRIAGVEVVLPPREMLGWRREVGAFERLPDWLDSLLDEADAVVVSIDTFAYGGLIPSRFSPEPIEQIQSRLRHLTEIRRRRPELPIYAANAIMRISNSNVAAEEPQYWSEYGTRIFRYSQLVHLEQQGELEGEDAAEFRRLENEVPQDVLQDYLSLRSRNHAVNREAIELTRSGVFDLLALSQDDSNPLGLHAMEQRHLRDLVAEHGLDHRVLIYPGADETGSVLVARAALKPAGLGRPRFAPRYSSTRGPFIVSNYEDRPLAETVKGQVLALGGLLVDSAGEADIQLFLNTPGERQGEAPHQDTFTRADTSARNLPEFVDALSHYLEEGRLCAVADVAYSNGADKKLIHMLEQRVAFPELAAYTGWNTSNNTIGTVIAQSAAWWLSGHQSLSDEERVARGRAHFQFTAERFAEDWGYQAVIRSEALYEEVRDAGLDVMRLGEGSDSVEQMVRERMQERIAPWLERHFAGRPLPCPSVGTEPAGGVGSAGDTPSARSAVPAPESAPAVRRVELDEIHLPWKRLFEIALRVAVE